MSSQTIEHIVLLRVKPETNPSKVDSMVNAINGLISLDPVHYLTAGPLLRNQSTSLTFTHLHHSRYQSKEDLNAYEDHPIHVNVYTNLVQSICEDIMAVDWVSTGPTGSIVPGSVMRVSVLKLKEGLGESEKRKVLGVIGGIKENFPSIDQISFGENFSPERAKGYSIASIAVFPGLTELEALDSESETVNLLKDRVVDLIETVVVVDYVVPQQQNAS